MPIVINTNASATEASFNLSKANDNLRRSIARLSSGSRITSPTDDAGGLAVAYKLQSGIKRTEASLNNQQNALSFLQVQDGVLEAIGEIVDRMSELRTMAADVSKNASDVENYSKEFLELQDQLNQMKREKFNGVELFTTEKEWERMQGINKENLVVNGDSYSANVGNASIGTRQTYEYFDNADTNNRTLQSYDKYEYQLFTHPSGNVSDGSVKLNIINLQMVLSIKDPSESFGLSISNVAGGTQPSISTGKTVNLAGLYTWSNTGTEPGTEPVSAISPGVSIYNGTNNTLVTSEFNSENYITDITKVSVEEFTNVIEKIADARAENGAEQQRINQIINLQQNNLANLEAAHGRIKDVDVALESTRLARHGVTVQAGAAMVAQANQMTGIALTLLQ